MSQVQITLDTADAQALRKTIMTILDGRPTNYFPGAPALLRQLDAVGVTAARSVKCPRCRHLSTSEDDLYQHLRTVERWPSEDAGSEAASLWRTR